VSTAGQLFVGVWTFMAIVSFIAHGGSIMTRERRKYIPVYGLKKAERTLRARSTSPMRGL